MRSNNIIYIYKFCFHIINFLTIILYIYPGNLLGWLFYQDFNREPKFTGDFIEISSTPTIDSLGYFYGSITKLLGFKPHQHEGKILGLAAFGRKTKVIKQISQMISFNKNQIILINDQ